MLWSVLGLVSSDKDLKIIVKNLDLLQLRQTILVSIHSFLDMLEKRFYLHYFLSITG